MESESTYTIGSGKKDNLNIPDMSESQITLTNQNNVISVKTISPFKNSLEQIYTGTINNLDKATETSLFVSKGTGFSVHKLTLPVNGIIHFGRSSANDVVIGQSFVSGVHFVLHISDGNIRIEDQNSTNGLYINGKRIKAAVLRQGDVINILTVKIKLMNNALSFENVGNTLDIKENINNKPEKAGNKAFSLKNADHSVQFRLSPRLQKQLPQEPIVLDRPPKKGQEFHPSNRVGQMISMGAIAGSSLFMGAFSPALAFARSASLAVGIYNIAASGKIDKQRKAEIEEYNRRRDEEYRSYIEAQKARIMATAKEQRDIITEENPDPMTCIEMLERMDRRIWERRSNDRDFLDVRLGMGYEELCVPIKNYAENRGLMMEDDELEELCNSIAEENNIVDYIPKRLPLMENSTIGILGDRDKAVYLIRNMIISLTTHHSANDVRIIGIFGNEERARWASLRWLPHIWDEGMQFRYLAFDKKRAHHLCDMLYDELKRRTNKENTSLSGKNKTSLPFYVIILGDMEMVEDEPILELLTSGNPDLCASTIFMFNELSLMPRDCNGFIDLTREFPYVYDRYHVNKQVAFSLDNSVSSQQFSQFARKMASIELKDSKVLNTLPSSISFMEGMGVRKIEQLDILNRWKNNNVSDSLKAPVGVLPTGTQYCLDIHYKAHGAHGLLAGTTGSGKSEILRTWILSMAVNYHPHQVNFVIIDYKGGGMANKLEALPHIVGKITNIDTNITRSLVSLKREAKRRMILLEKYQGVDDIDQYMQLYYSGKVTEPMPHLIIVSDEFAELKKEEPEFMKELSSIARVGRSVGIHLVLATQRPSGVVDDQIDSNSRFRICMKVNSVQDSKEMIKRPDAAGITQRGRAFVRIGEDEEFCLIQSFWSGAEYLGEDNNPYSDQVRLVDVSGERIKRESREASEKSKIRPDQLTSIVSYINELAEKNGIKRLEGPWKPALPEILPFHELSLVPNFQDADWTSDELNLKIPVGIYDCPAFQEQGIRYLDFDQTPHYGIYGAPVSGKTTFLRMLIFSIALFNSPENVNIHILDFGGGSLTVYEKLPHVVNIIKEDEGEKLDRFIEWIEKEIQVRKNCFRKEKVSNFSQYSARKKNTNMPALFVVIDNQLRLSTLVNDIDQFLIDLSMTGSDCGIHLVFTSNNVNKTSMNLQTNIGGNISLHMADKNDYRSVISEFPDGSGFPSNPGRGLIRDSSVAEFQTFIFRPSDNDEENVKQFDDIIRKMSEIRRGEGAGRIKTMPDEILGSDIAEYYGNRDIIPFGIDYENYQPVYMNLHDKHSFLISTKNEDTANRIISSVINVILTRRDNKTIILDPGNSLSSFKNRCSSYSSDPGQMSKIIRSVAREMEKREDIVFSQTDNSEESDTMPKQQICLILSKLHGITDELDDDDRELLIQICRNTENLGVIVIGCGTTEEIAADICIDELTISMVDSPEISDYAQENWQKGLCSGGRLIDHDYFFMDMFTREEKFSDISDGDGIMFDCGRAVRVKLIQ